MLRVALATAAMAVPHHVKLSPSKRTRREPVPVVATRVDSAIALPPHQAYDDLIREAANRHHVDAALIKSVMQTESAFNALAVSRAGAQGLMQLMPQLAEELGIEDPFDARQNIMGGTLYLRQLLDRYRGNLRLVLAGYNAGTTTVTRHGGVPPFPETRKYIKRVTELLERARRDEKS